MKVINLFLSFLLVVAFASVVQATNNEVSEGTLRGLKKKTVRRGGGCGRITEETECGSQFGCEWCSCESDFECPMDKNGAYKGKFRSGGKCVTSGEACEE